jgi:hypothetical protein
MNDRGKPLSTVDMLKSFFLSHVRNQTRLDHLNSIWRSAAYEINTWDDNYYSEREISFFKTWFRSKYTTKPDELIGKTSNKELERINNSLNRWARENSPRLNWNTEDVIVSLVEDDLKYFSSIYTLILKKTSYFNGLFDSIFYNRATEFSWQVTILLSAIKVGDDENEVSRKLRVVSKYIDIWIVSHFANGKRLKSTYFSKELPELVIDIRDMDFDILKDYLIRRIDSSELKIEGGAMGKRRGIKDLRLNQYTKKGVRYILARISDYIMRGSEDDERTFFYWYMNKTDIEHIIEDNYDRYAEDYSEQSVFDSYRNSIGALILIDKGVNKSIQSKPFKLKKDHYNTSGFFASSLCEDTYVHQTGFKNFINQHSFDFKPYDKFGIQEINERTELVAKIADYIWNRDRIIEIE